MNNVDVIARSIDFIETNLKKKITLKEISDFCGYSQYYFIKLFNGVTGFTPMEYLLKRKLSQIAMTLISSQEKNIQIAFDYGFEGLEHIDKIISIDQSPIGRNARSNPATYVGLFDLIRKEFAKTKEAVAKKYKEGRFSFNSKAGQCEVCKGLGEKEVEMHFMSDVKVTCPECHGKRYNRKTLEIKLNNKSIADVLEMEVQEALEIFDGYPKIKHILKTLKDVGLDYIKLGQSAMTLSGGEAQRIKLVKELCREDTGKTVYLLDEPTTGLHFEDIAKLLKILNNLVGAGNTVILIEHNMDVVLASDWVIDMGPTGGEAGGYIVGVGTPEDIARTKGSITGKYLDSQIN